MKKADTPKMTMPEFYQAVGGDIDDVIERLEDLDIVKWNLLGFEDDPSYSELLQSLDQHNKKDAFRAAHTLKGICYTFGFQRLGDSASVICEKLREGKAPTKESLYQLSEDYHTVIRAIRCLRNSL